MTSGAPWSVKGISPRTREIAKDLARREGLTLGELLNRVLQDGSEAGPAPTPAFEQPAAGPSVLESPRYGHDAPARFEAAGHPADEVGRVASALESLSERIEAAERRSSSAISGIDHSVRGALQRLELSERAHIPDAARFEDLAGEIKTEQVRAAERVRRLEAEAQGPRSAEALRALEGALGKLAGRLYEDEARTREAIAELQAKAAQPQETIDPEALVEAVVNRIGERLEAAQEATSGALRDLGSSFTVLDRRLRAVETQGGPDLEQRFARLSAELALKMEQSRLEMAAKLRDAADGRFDRMDGKLSEMAAYVQAAEHRSAQAMEKMGREVVGMADSLNQRIQGSENRSAQAIEQAGGEMSRIAAVMEQRLGRADNVQAQALEKLGTEIARITERLAERIANAERRNALAIDDVGEQVARVTERLNQRHERGSADLAERIRLSEERTAKLLDEAREKIDSSLSRRFSEPTPAHAPPLAPSPLSMAPAHEPEAKAASPFTAMAAMFNKPAEEVPPSPPPEIEPEPFGAAAFPSAPPGEPRFDPEDFEAADGFEAIDEFEADEAAQPDAYDAANPFGADLGPAPAGLEQVRTLSTRDVIEQGRAAARAAAQGDPRNRKARAETSADNEPRKGSLFTGFGGKPKKRAGSTLQTMLIFSGLAAAVGAGLAAYYLGVAEPTGTPSPRVLEARNAQAGAAEVQLTENGTTPVLPDARAAMAVTPLPTEGGPAPLAVPGEDPAALYTDAVRRIEAKDNTGIEMLRRAANQGHAAAQFYLATLYENGEGGLKKDALEARRWTERAAQLGDRKAMHNLGLYYFEGSGGAKNSTTAAQWFRRAADLGLVDSQYNLARLYEEGLGVTENDAEAYKWYLIAAKNGDSESQKSAVRIKSQLTAEAQGASERSANGFKPTAPNPSLAAAPAAAGGAAGVRTAQRALSKLGYYQGPQDGAASPALKLAIAAYQRDQGVASTGNLDADVLSRLQTFAR